MLLEAQTSPLEVRWLVTDHLGSPRMVVDKGGGVRRRDFLPFGEELAANIGHRNAPGAGYISDQVRQKFGSKERDIETELDFMEARYSGSVMGRFTSVDPFDPILGKQGARDDVREEAEREFRQYLLEPSRWNRYVYALNNPLKYTDPDGMDPVTVNLNIIYDENSSYTEEEKNRIRQTYIEQARKALGNVDINFNITETTGTASDIRGNARITSGFREGALNAFFTKSDVEGGIFPRTEKTEYRTGSIFLSTTKGGTDEPAHGIIHALGVSAYAANGYGVLAELYTLYAVKSLLYFNRRPSYVDNRPLYEYSGYTQAKVGFPPKLYDIRSVFDVIRDGARKLQRPVQR